MSRKAVGYFARENILVWSVDLNHLGLVMLFLIDQWNE